MEDFKERRERSIKRDYERGVELRIIVKRWNISPEELKALIPKSKFPKPRGLRGGREKMFTHEDVKDILRDHRRGLSRKELSLKYSTSEGTIQRVISGKYLG